MKRVTFGTSTKWFAFNVLVGSSETACSRGKQDIKCTYARVHLANSGCSDARTDAFNKNSISHHLHMAVFSDVQQKSKSQTNANAIALRHLIGLDPG